LLSTKNSTSRNRDAGPKIPQSRGHESRESMAAHGRFLHSAKDPVSVAIFRVAASASGYLYPSRHSEIPVDRRGKRRSGPLGERARRPFGRRAKAPLTGQLSIDCSMDETSTPIILMLSRTYPAPLRARCIRTRRASAAFTSVMPPPKMLYRRRSSSAPTIFSNSSRTRWSVRSA